LSARSDAGLHLGQNDLVIPVLFPDEVRALDAAAPVDRDVLIARAGQAVAREALVMLGGAYGRRVVVVVGPGSNGADALTAAQLLERRGVRVHLVMVDRNNPPPARLPRADLIIDGAYGISLNSPYTAPEVGAPVLAIDIPSGLDPCTGYPFPGGSAVVADVTVTFVGMKPGLLLGDGPAYAGRVVVADIGLDASGYHHAGVMTRDDVAHRLPHRERSAHKWEAALLVIAGSPGMTGAPLLVAQGAQRTGAGMVRLAVPGQTIGGTEAVSVALPAEHWAQHALTLTERCAAMVIGPGLGRERTTRASIRQVLSKTSLPTVIDADGLMSLAPGSAEEDPRAMVRTLGTSAITRRPGLTAAAAASAAEAARQSSVGDLPPGQRAVLQAASRRIGANPAAAAAAGTARTAEFDAAVRGLSGRPPGSTILTPHEGEFRSMTGQPLSPDRFSDVRRLAAATGAVVLLKGPTTLIASPDGWVNVVSAGDQRLATAGTGDVLAGVIGALLAQGLNTLDAASVGAWLHGTAATLGPRTGLVASDLPALVAAVMSDVAPTWTEHR
jgi:ADP-dependent NAD(P)H-hydrate dehydratase / NAD(P)H-hydrate epimerase